MRNAHVHPIFRDLLNTISGPGRLEPFSGSDVARDGAEIGGCSPKDATEPREGGVVGSIPARSTNLAPSTKDVCWEHGPGGPIRLSFVVRVF